MSATTDLQAEVFADLEEEELSFSCVLTKVTGGTLDVASDTRVGAITTNHPAYLIILGGLDTRFAAVSSELKEGDVKMSFAANGIVPEKTDRFVLVDGRAYTIVQAPIEDSVGHAALFVLWAREDNGN